jgi:hypothetical protein
MSTRPSTPNTVIYDNEYKASNMAATFRPASGKSLLAPPPASYHSPVSPDRSDDAHRYVYQYALSAHATIRSAITQPLSFTFI